MTQTRSLRDTSTTAAWRLLHTGAQDGATNMAIDEAILESVSRGDSPPTLRFYSWDPPCFSLGYAQKWAVVDCDACARLGWDVVRRATGGRAILHADELTYTVCAPQTEPRVKGSVLESYQRLSEALLEGLLRMGLEPARAHPAYENQGRAGPACFDGPSNYEITVGQRKLVGSAQMRKKGVVLQHGTLPLHGDVARIAGALAVETPGQRPAIEVQLRSRATTLEQCLGRRVEFDEAAAFMQAGFRHILNLELQPAALTNKEKARAEELRAEKYGNEVWTKRR